MFQSIAREQKIRTSRPARAIEDLQRHFGVPGEPLRRSSRLLTALDKGLQITSCTIEAGRSTLVSIAAESETRRTAAPKLSAITRAVGLWAGKIETGIRHHAPSQVQDQPATFSPYPRVLRKATKFFKKRWFFITLTVIHQSPAYQQSFMAPK
jgi:hypothetical protein